MEQGKALGYAQHDHGEVEQDGPEGGDHFGAENGEICRYKFSCKPVHLIATFNQGIAPGLDDSNPRKEGYVVKFSRFG